MRSPTRPLFKGYEIITILAFAVMAGGLAALKLVY